MVEAPLLVVFFPPAVWPREVLDDDEDTVDDADADDGDDDDSRKWLFTWMVASDMGMERLHTGHVVEFLSGSNREEILCADDEDAEVAEDADEDEEDEDGIDEVVDEVNENGDVGPILVVLLFSFFLCCTGSIIFVDLNWSGMVVPLPLLLQL